MVRSVSGTAMYTKIHVMNNKLSGKLRYPATLLSGGAGCRSFHRRYTLWLSTERGQLFMERIGEWEVDLIDSGFCLKLRLCINGTERWYCKTTAVGRDSSIISIVFELVCTCSILSLTEISWKQTQPISLLLRWPSSRVTMRSPHWSVLLPTRTTGTSVTASWNSMRPTGVLDNLVKHAHKHVRHQHKNTVNQGCTFFFPPCKRPRTLLCAGLWAAWLKITISGTLNP